jgi:Tol biopolymer transport system component
MPLSTGDKLGPYEILASIGAGGMGKVYRAYDSRLNRDVAIKVSNAEFNERFTREARAIAALNHANICHLYDVGPDYLVMEYVEGHDLRGPLNFDDALPIIRQLIDGIEAAHEKNIIHRDLKPANIKITTDGVVKILDFGLAKAMAAPPSKDGNLDNSPTLTIDATQAGTILGTPAYMAPEQARGKAADRRSDIWSFGVILYELLTGRRLFPGETAVEVLGAVLNRDPEISAAPPRMHKLLRWCLETDRKQRLASISDARRMLGQDDGGMDESAAAIAPLPPRSGKLPWVVVAVLLAVATAVALSALWRVARPVEGPVVRLDVDLGPEVSLPAPHQGSVVISPDGTRLAYVSSAPGGQPKVFTRRLDQPKATELPGTEGASRLFFSPDGQWVGFYISTKLKRISVEGGAVVTVSGDPSAHASWGDDGSTVLEIVGKGLVRIPPGGGAPTPVTENSSVELTHAFPQILPGSRAVLFVAVPLSYDADQSQIEVVNLADRRRKVLVQGGTSPHYLMSGHLVYARMGALFAIPFDLDKLETRGTATSVLDQVAFRPNSSGADFDVSKTGTLIYRRGNGGSSGMRTIQWVDGAGKTETLLAKPGAYSHLRLSPDGKRLSFLDAGEVSRDVWVYDARRDAMTRLTFGGRHVSPIWSLDGRCIVFGLPNGLYWTRADGAGQPQPLTQSKTTQIPVSFTPDGKRLAYEDYGGGNAQLFTVPVEDQGGQLKAGKPEQFLKTSFADQAPFFSPDGRWLAYESNESGKLEVYVRAFPPLSGQGGKWQISNSGGNNPLWSRNGHDLVYQSGDQIMAASYTVKGDTFVADKPRVWIAKLGGPYWDLPPDGKRVAVLTPVKSAEAPKQEHEVVFIENFFDELRRRVPVGSK